MGTERLTRLVALLAVGLVAACAAPSRAPANAGPPPPRHLQIFPALTAPGRHALVDRLRALNPVARGTEWQVNEEALATSMTVVDPFAAFLRRAKRSDRGSSRSPAADPVKAIGAARAFVQRNAELLGLPRHVVIGLSEQERLVNATDHASRRAMFVVRFEAPFHSKGYEGFKELDNQAELDVYVDDDGEVSSFVNTSRIHPRLMLDTKPALSQSDPRLLSHLVGRKVFALALDPGASPEDVRTLGRIPLGEVAVEDVSHVQLIIQATPGPQLAWMTYRLAYFVQVTKEEAFFFRYVVDADSGDVIEDARPPLVPDAVPGADG